MRSAISACAAASVAMASYLAASLGLDAARVLATPLNGLEELRRAEPLFAIRRLLALDPAALVWMAACLGAAELAVMAILVAYLVERLSGRIALAGAHQTLRAGLVLAAVVALAAAAGAAVVGDSAAMAAATVQIVVIGAAVLCRQDESAAEPAAESPRRATRWRDTRLEGWFAA
jgi:hypothetical protein